jgi:hypothetical protein
MGTRCDLYVGQGVDAEWLGSFAWDGYPDGPVSVLFDCATEEDWRQRVRTFLHGRTDSTFPEQGWPWPWEDSRTTDFSYAFFDGKVWACCFGHAPWQIAAQWHDDDVETPKMIFPDMRTRQHVRFDEGSGIIIVSQH